MSRKITQYQFSGNTTLAAERLDAAWQAVADRFDSIDISDLRRRGWEDHFVFGYRPRVVGWEPDGVGTGHPSELPWLPGQTKLNNLDISQFKGYNFPGIYPTGQGTTTVWGITWHTGFDPQVVDALDMHLDIDFDSAYYPDGWEWNANPPSSLSIGDWVEDIGLELLVDNPNDPDNPSSSSVLVYRAGISVDSSYNFTAPPYGNVVLPPFPGGGVYGVMLTANGLGLPIPAFSRVRLLITLPDYSNISSIGTGDVRWKTTVNAPFALQAYTGAVNLILPRDSVKD